MCYYTRNMKIAKFYHNKLISPQIFQMKNMCTLSKEKIYQLTAAVLQLVCSNAFAQRGLKLEKLYRYFLNLQLSP